MCITYCKWGDRSTNALCYVLFSKALNDKKIGHVIIKV